MSTCQEVMGWISDGVFLDSARTQPLKVVACITSTIDALVEMLLERQQNPGGLASQDDSETIICGKAICKATGQDVDDPNGLGGVFSDLLIKLLMQKLSEILADLIENVVIDTDEPVPDAN